eukprot:5743407-Lingulodinium_polyedra.AAC.1
MCARHPSTTARWSTRGVRIAKCAAPQQWNAFMSVFPSSSRARVAQTCRQKCMSLLRRGALLNARVACVDGHTVFDVWSAQ